MSKPSAEQWSHLTERERLPREAVREPRTLVETQLVCLVIPNCLNSHATRQNMNQMSHLCLNSPMSRCLDRPEPCSPSRMHALSTTASLCE